VNWCRTAWTLLLATCAATVLPAQSPGGDRDLPVAGSLLYNVLFLSHPPGLERTGANGRFAGRFAIRAGQGTYVGVGVGSWAQASLDSCLEPFECGTFADHWSEAVVYQAYVQHIPTRAVPAWLRVGVGVANTWTLLPEGSVIGAAERWRAALTAGAGADVRIRGHVFVTTSIDYTHLSGVDARGAELRHGLALGIGATIR
jgi:hypothetical protein